jgi:outer membrane protein assembly factor BamD (BamD/ComL family)
VSATATLAEQLAQLKAARARLRAGDAAGALRLLDEYQTDPHGTALAAEASLLRIEALAASGKRAEAASEARRFGTDFPTSPLIDRARSFVAVDAARSSDVSP